MLDFVYMNNVFTEWSTHKKSLITPSVIGLFLFAIGPLGNNAWYYILFAPLMYLAYGNLYDIMFKKRSKYADTAGIAFALTLIIFQVSFWLLLLEMAGNR